MGRHRSYQEIPFDDRTLGSLLWEFYLVVAAEHDELSSRRDNLKTHEFDRLRVLDRILEGETSGGVTGDPLVDYWEYRIAKGLDPDLEQKVAPPREMWDRLVDREKAFTAAAGQ